jgi:hypothetical protein
MRYNRNGKIVDKRNNYAAQDSGNGRVGTLVFPVKATYTVKTHSRTATEVEEGWVRIFNFYVNAFGEWAIGSEETIKGGKAKRINKEMR